MKSYIEWEIIKKYLVSQKQDIKFSDIDDINIEINTWMFYVRLLSDAFIIQVFPERKYEIIFNIPKNLTLIRLFKLAKESTSKKISMTLERRIDQLT